MKVLLRRFLSPEQYDALRSFKRKATSFARCSLGRPIRLLPIRMRLFLKDAANTVSRLDYPSADIFLHVDSEIEYATRLHSSRKEPETVAWIETLFKPGDVFFDVGANVGAYSLIAASRMRGHSRIYAFEPAFPNYGQLCKNVLLNGFQDVIVPLLIALSDVTGFVKLNYHDLISGGALHACGEAIDHRGAPFAPVYGQQVLAYRLDDLITAFGLPVPTHMKIDVDGTEFLILKGAERTLSDPRLRSVLVELREESDRGDQIITFLLHKGFEVVHGHAGDRAVGGEARTRNYIFRKPTPPAGGSERNSG